MNFEVTKQRPYFCSEDIDFDPIFVLKILILGSHLSTSKMISPERKSEDGKVCGNRKGRQQAQILRALEPIRIKVIERYGKVRPI